MFISVFNYICQMGCSPREMPRCWLGVAWGNCLLFALQTENFTSLFSGDSFCFLLQSCRFCDSKYVIARTKRKRPPLVRGHHWSPASSSISETPAVRDFVLLVSFSIFSNRRSLQTQMHKHWKHKILYAVL